MLLLPIQLLDMAGGGPPTGGGGGGGGFNGTAVYAKLSIGIRGIAMSSWVLACIIKEMLQRMGLLR